MMLLPLRADRGWNSVLMLTGLALTLTLIPGACAQAPDAQSKPVESKALPETVETLYITRATTQNDLNDVQTALRNMVPKAKIYATPTQNAISIRATEEDMQLAKKMIADLDRPRKAYRVTYTFTEMDNGKRVGVQHLTLLVLAGGKAMLKQGSRVPIVTGTMDKESGGQSSQVQYLDVGLNIEATLDGDRLRSKVEQSSVADEKSGIGTQDPIVLQTMVEDVSDVVPGKSFVLGSLDIPGTMRHREIEATAELIQ
jgi:type II secretory pathway component GspD/PulD (secretin)